MAAILTFLSLAAAARAWLSLLALLHGFGGVGKSLLGQQIGTVGAFGLEFVGNVVNADRVLGWWGEDGKDEIWRRQEDINRALGIPSLADLDSRVFWRPCPADDITLFTAANESDFKTTQEFDVLREQIHDLKIKLTFLDSATQIAALPENNRPLVTRCIQALTSLCLQSESTICLIGHNNRQGDYSGTSAWENRVRSRCHMKREKAEDGTDTIKLCRPKANYADREEGIALEWHRGAYRCTDRRFETYGDRLERECRERELEQHFLDALDHLTERHRAVSASRHAGNYAPKVMVQSGLVNGVGSKDLERAMERLFNAGQIIPDAQLPWRKPDRHFAIGLGRKGAGE